MAYHRVQVETKEKVIISPLFQQITGVVVDKEKEELFARDEVLRHEVHGALQKLEVALDETYKTKIDYDEKVKLLADEDERLMHKKFIYKSKSKNLKFQSKKSISKKLN